MVSCERCQIRNEEKVEEEFNTIRLVSLGEDEILMIGTDEWAFDERCCFV